MKKLFLALLLCLGIPASLQAGRPWRCLHNNDGTDLLSNIWHGGSKAPARPSPSDNPRT